MPSINTAAKLVRKKKDKGVGKKLDVIRVDSTPDMLNLWTELASNWFLAIMQPHNGHSSQVTYKTYWTKIPFIDTVQTFYSACVNQKGKGTVRDIKSSIIHTFDKWEEKEMLGEMHLKASNAIDYRLAKHVCPDSSSLQPLDIQSRRLMRNALEFCKQIVAEEPQPQFQPTRRRRETYSHALEKHPYKHVTWVHFPVKMIVLSGDHSMYSSHENYKGEWYRPNALFFKDVLVKERKFGFLGNEPIHLGFVTPQSKVIPETLDTFRQEIKAKHQGYFGKIETTYTPAEIQAAARPFLNSFGLSRVKVQTLDEAVAILTEAEVGHEHKNKKGTEDRVRAAASFYRGNLNHILQEGSHRKPTRPMSLIQKRAKPVYNIDPIQDVCRQFQSCTMKAFHEGKQVRPEPFAPKLQVKSLSDMMAKLRLQSLQARQDLCDSCNQTCFPSKGALKTAHEGTIKTFCSELCYTTKTANDINRENVN